MMPVSPIASSYLSPDDSYVRLTAAPLVLSGAAACFYNFWPKIHNNEIPNVAVLATLIRYAVDISIMEVSTMGRKVNSERLEEVVQTIREHDGQIRANDIAKELDLHPEAVARLLAAADRESEALLIEDDQGYLGIFKKWW
jgi:hypothetical protein